MKSIPETIESYKTLYSGLMTNRTQLEALVSNYKSMVSEFQKLSDLNNKLEIIARGTVSSESVKLGDLTDLQYVDDYIGRCSGKVVSSYTNTYDIIKSLIESIKNKQNTIEKLKDRASNTESHERSQTVDMMVKFKNDINTLQNRLVQEVTLFAKARKSIFEALSCYEIKIAKLIELTNDEVHEIFRTNNSAYSIESIDDCNRKLGSYVKSGKQPWKKIKS